MLAVLLVLHCITTTNAALSTPPVPAVTNSRTTLLTGYGPTSNVITTLLINTSLEIYCRVSDVYVFDDPWWLNVTVPDLGIQGWVADYYADCGYIGYCQAALC